MMELAGIRPFLSMPGGPRPDAAAAPPPPDDGPAPDGPGPDAYWTNANKVGVGTANNFTSKVWFTLTGGRLTEVYYPTLDQANLRELKFAVSDGRNFTVIDSETRHNHFCVTETDALAFQYNSVDKKHGFELSKKYITDPKRNVVLIDVDFKSQYPLDLYVIQSPAVGNCAHHNNGRTESGALVASNGDVASALSCSSGFEETSSTYVGKSDALKELLDSHRLVHHYSSAVDGNLLQVGKIGSGNRHFTLALGFGQDVQQAVGEAQSSLRDGFASAYQEYGSGWSQFVRQLKPVDKRYEEIYKIACMTLMAHEDKEHPGAFVASLTIPWGQRVNANEPTAGGYHLVWGRDQYFIATAFVAMGVPEPAERALDYLFNYQQREDGSIPQNTWLDGKPYFESLQMDEVAFPLILAYQLGRADAATYSRHIKPGADFIASKGPRTPEERWEESDGLSPSTIAAEIAGLVCAADIARKNDDKKSAEHWLDIADNWVTNLENWLVTTTGPYGDQYYMRINDNFDPNDGHKRRINNGGGEHDERSIVDLGFLELVRLGIKPADDPIIKKSLAVVDRLLKVMTPRGAGYYRYNFDGYGEKVDGRGFDGTGTGRLWPLLTGERGEFELAAGRDARPYLDALVNFANDGKLLPEQVFDRSNPLHDPAMNLGKAALTLKDYFGEAAQADGQDDGFISRSDLESMLGRVDAPLKLRQSAQYLLDHPTLLNTLDVAGGQGGFDDKIGKGDLDAAIGWYSHQEDADGLTTTEAGVGQGTGSATPLAWATAQLIRLARGVTEGRVLDVPGAVAARYLKQP